MFEDHLGSEIILVLFISNEWIDTRGNLFSLQAFLICEHAL